MKTKDPINDHILGFTLAMVEWGDPIPGYAYEMQRVDMHPHWLNEAEAAERCISFQTVSSAADYEKYLLYEQRMVGFFIQLAATTTLFSFDKRKQRFVRLEQLPKLINQVTLGTRETATYAIYAKELGLIFTNGFDVSSVVYAMDKIDSAAEATVTQLADANNLYILS